MMDTRPKILLFSHLCSSGFVTGAEKLLLLFARQMASRYQCVLVVPCEGVLSTKAREIGIPVIVFEIPLCVALYTSNSQVKAQLENLKGQFVYQQLLALLVHERPQIVFSNTCVHPLPAVAAKSLGIPAVWSVMESIQPGPYRSQALDVISEASDIIVGISETTLAPFRGHPGESKLHVLSPYVAADELDSPGWPAYRAMLRQQYGWLDQHVVIGFIAGTIYRQKGLEAFVLAARQLYDPGRRLRFLAVGNSLDDAHMQTCRALVAESGLEGQFAWISFAERIEHVYPAMDVVVVPSLQIEGFGMTALEGMYFGKPVVAFASGGLAEIMMATGNERFLARTGHVEELADRMAQLANDDALRFDVGNRNAQAARTVFGAESLLVQLDALRTRLPLVLPFLSPLIRGNRKTVYLVENGHRRPFVSVKALLQRGFRFEDVRQVTNRELRQIRRGAPIAEWPLLRLRQVRTAAGKRRRLRRRRRYRLVTPDRLRSRRRIRVVLHRRSVRHRRRTGTARRRRPAVRSNRRLRRLTRATGRSRLRIRQRKRK